MAIIDLQRRIAEVGRIRIGEQVPIGNTGKTRPAKLDTFRLTSPDRTRIEAAARLYGGTVKPWKSPAGNQFEVKTTTNTLPVLVPPALAFTQFYELWSRGGCQRRCDGQTDQITDGPCQCDPDQRECAIHTRLSVFLPDIPGWGVWRIESQGYYAAAELAGAVDLLTYLKPFAERGIIPATLRLEQRAITRDGQTRRFAVPMLDPSINLGQLTQPPPRTDVEFLDIGPGGVVLTPAAGERAGAYPPDSEGKRLPVDYRQPPGTDDYPQVMDEPEPPPPPAKRRGRPRKKPAAPEPDPGTAGAHDYSEGPPVQPAGPLTPPPAKRVPSIADQIAPTLTPPPTPPRRANSAAPIPVTGIPPRTRRQAATLTEGPPTTNAQSPDSRPGPQEAGESAASMDAEIATIAASYNAQGVTAAPLTDDDDDRAPGPGQLALAEPATFTGGIPETKLLSDKQFKKLMALLAAAGYTEHDTRVAFLSACLERTIETTKELSSDEANTAIDILEHDEPTPPEPPEAP